MRITEAIQKIKEIGKSTEDKQKMISTGDVWHLWMILTERYSVRFTTQIFLDAVQDNDFRVILESGLPVIDKQINVLEETMLNYGIPLPERAAFDVNTTETSEAFTDKYIFGRLFVGVRDFMPTILTAYSSSDSPKIKELMKDFLLKEMDLYDKLGAYGLIKSWIPIAPRYN